MVSAAPCSVASSYVLNAAVVASQSLTLTAGCELRVLNGAHGLLRAPCPQRRAHALCHHAGMKTGCSLKCLREKEDEEEEDICGHVGPTCDNG